MKIINIKKLVALDMSLNNSWIILIEFIVGSLGPLALAYFIYEPTTLNLLKTLWLVGVGINYIPLAIYATSFQIHNNYRLISKDVMIAPIRKKYNLQQFLVLIPFFIMIMSVAQKWNGEEVI